MQENQYEKIKLLFLKLIEETKELNEAEFEKVLIQVFKENNSFSIEVKDRLIFHLTNMRKKYELQIENVFGVFENVFDNNMFKFNSYKSSFEKK